MHVTPLILFFFFFNDTATTEIYTLSLHDALPISPRDDHQWAAWVAVMGSPSWAKEPRFAGKPDRVVNWDALYALMSEWSRHYDKQAIADLAQAAHVPSFPLREPAEIGRAHV